MTLVEAFQKRELFLQTVLLSVVVLRSSACTGWAQVTFAALVQPAAQREDMEADQSGSMPYVDVRNSPHDKRTGWGLKKLIVAVTSSGLMFGLNSEDAQKLWSVWTLNSAWDLAVISEFHQAHSLNPQVR